MAQPWPDHLLTLEEFEALPKDNTRRYELQEGVLIVTPRPTPLHQRVIYRLVESLEEQLPAEWTALGEVEVVTDPGVPARVRVPDVVITSDDAVEDSTRLFADQILVAVEIVSPGSGDTDKVLKPVEYAKAGIPHYWVIDLEPPVSLASYHLAGDLGYQEAPAETGVFGTVEPFPLTIDLPALVAPRTRHVRKVDL